ncbi:S4 domain-containing protein, partial [Vibrio parahaemolyticus]|uniref:S4 domain-containing protein n=1 Tax=Vibrio parahaemolyticus TaxID=670 RepID=UPI003F6640C9
MAQAFREVPTTRLPSPAGLTLVDVLLRTGLAPSKRAARELLASGAVLVNGRRVTDPAEGLSGDMALHGRYLILRKGKRTYHLVT